MGLSFDKHESIGWRKVVHPVLIDYLIRGTEVRCALSDSGLTMEISLLVNVRILVRKFERIHNYSF
jgi:hypothetical protein